MVLMPEDKIELEKLYKEHAGVKDTFVFKGQEMYVDYVKYLLEYLKNQPEFMKEETK